jgi:hypothetical protein
VHFFPIQLAHSARVFFEPHFHVPDMKTSAFRASLARSAAKGSSTALAPSMSPTTLFSCSSNAAISAR